MAISSVSPSSGSTILNSWKEIAAYIGRGVRTVQRWESIGLPVRRPRAHSRSAVIAMSDEIDAWLRSAPTAETTTQSNDGVVLRTTQAAASIRQAITDYRESRERNRRFLAAHHDARRRLAANIIALHQEIATGKDLNLPTPWAIAAD